MIYYNFLADIARRQREALFRYGLIPVGEVVTEPITLAQARLHCRVDTFEEGSPPETVSEDDAWLTDIGIPAAREYCEGELGRALAPRTMELVTDTFPGYAAATPPGTGFNLPFGPVQSITSVKYLDQAVADAAYTAAYDAEFLISADVDLATAAGDAAAAAAIEVTMDAADYALDTYAAPARLNLATGASWPTSNGTVNSVKIRYVTGYTIPGDSPQVHVLPKLALSAMLLMLGHLYANREATAVDKALVEIPFGVSSLLGLVPGRERIGFA